MASHSNIKFAGRPGILPPASRERASTGHLFTLTGYTSQQENLKAEVKKWNKKQNISRGTAAERSCAVNKYPRAFCFFGGVFCLEELPLYSWMLKSTNQFFLDCFQKGLSCVSGTVLLDDKHLKGSDRMTFHCCSEQQCSTNTNPDSTLPLDGYFKLKETERDYEKPCPLTFSTC